MELTVGYLRKIINNIDDEVILSSLEIGNTKHNSFSSIKRLLLLKDESEDKTWGGKTYLAINSMGTHFTGKEEQRGLVYKDYFDEEKVNVE